MSVAGSFSAFVEAAFEKLWCDIPEDVQSMMEKSELRKHWGSTELESLSQKFATAQAEAAFASSRQTELSGKCGDDSDLSVYKLQSGDLQPEGLQLGPELQFHSGSEVVPDAALAGLIPLAGKFHSAPTCGDGACGLHAIFGCPTREEMQARVVLKCKLARSRILSKFGHTLAETQSICEGSTALTSVASSWWEDALLPVLKGGGEIEARIFTRCLHEMDTALFVEAALAATRSVEQSDEAVKARARLVRAARQFFCKTREEHVVRPLSMCMEFVPDSSSYIEQDRMQLDTVVQHHGGNACEFLSPAFYLGANGQMRVKGTLEPFPDGGPRSKYEALFTSHVAFDAIRVGFITGPVGTTFADTLRAVLEGDGVLPADIEVAHELLAAAQALASITSQQHTPDNFAERVWPAFCAALRDDRYYLSVDELLVVCKCARQSVVVFQQVAGVLRLIGGCAAAGSDPVFVALSGNNSRRVRGHFERLFIAEELEEVKKAHLHEEMVGTSLSSAVSSDDDSSESCASSLDTIDSCASSPSRPPRPHGGDGSLADLGSRCDALGSAHDGLPCDGSGASKPGHALPEGDCDQQSDCSSSVDSKEGSSDLLQVTQRASETPGVEQDAWDACAHILAAFLRRRPTLPASAEDPTISFTQVSVPIRLPLYSCPFRGCRFHTDCEEEHRRHVASRLPEDPHHHILSATCGPYLKMIDSLDFVHRAMSLIEKQQIPCVGPATTRRALRTLTTKYNDSKVRALCCFVCGQVHTTMQGGALDSGDMIKMCSAEWLLSMERHHPGTLLNNCSFELWKARYEEGRYDSTDRGGPNPASGRRWPQQNALHPEYELSEWCVGLPTDEAVLARQSVTRSAKCIVLFGVTEDVECRKQHQCHSVEEKGQWPFCRVLCNACSVPICSECQLGLARFNKGSKRSTIPMAIANDSFYGYALRLLVEKRVTWLECACASLVWTTIMVYYLEEPYGHLMLEEMEGAQARTQVRGNLFSFSLPWEDIEKRCSEASAKWDVALEKYRSTVALPHAEDVLAALVNVHIVGGAKDLVSHLEGATMRTGVVLALIEELRSSGYPGYAADINASEAVRQRVQEMYVDKYGEGPFVPEKVREAAEAAHKARLSGESLIHDKNATPAEPKQQLRDFEATTRPFSIVAARSSCGASTVHEEHATILARYQTVEITTGSTMLDQFQPQYLGMAHPFTMPLAVGSYDVPGKPRWRRPTEEQLAAERLSDIGCPVLQCSFTKSQAQVAPAHVKLFDMTKGMARRVEAQFRRHWSFVPSLWNLYFREQVNLGTSLSAMSRGAKAQPQDAVEQDAAMAAADLIEKAHSGFYRTQEGKRCPIQGDMSKLRFAEGITPMQKRLLADFSFRTRSIPGTQEIRTKMGHVCYWASVVYGNGIFMTVSPGERHNYIAIRLSRYRARDPYIACTPSADQQRHWVGHSKPSLESREDDVFEFDVPGYDLRRLIQARDPLAPALAFAIQIRCIMATLFGVRMCANCPHCAEAESPCMDAFGSNAETVGGLAGRSDGFCGAVECQKSSGSLHLHFWNFVQRAHQHHTLAEIAAMLESALIDLAQMKAFSTEICCESYPLPEQAARDIPEMEARWPKFSEGDSSSPGKKVSWGKHRLGRIPPFIWQDSGVDYKAYSDSPADAKPHLWVQLMEDASDWDTQYKAALQENQMCVQHHIHPKNQATGARYLPKACKSSRCKDECKHGFPRDNRVNPGAPLLVCKGLAKSMGLPASGTRSTLGSILGTRNDPWLDGTSPGLCIGMSGGNTDVQLNDLMPIMACTHEDHACGRACVPTDPAKRSKALVKMIRRLQTTQSQRTGYIGGYMNKRQKAGRLEARKCIDKMHALRARVEGKSEYQQQRAVSGRLITDIEMNGTMRGAVEEHNLCINLRSNDVLFAECIRTFPTVHVNAQQWLHRLEVELERSTMVKTNTPVPASRRPNARSLHSKAPWMDLYGFRPLVFPFINLSPFEFFRHFQGAALVPPSRWEARTTWTQEGQRLNAAEAFSDGQTKIVPGVHYEVKEPGDETSYFSFPAEPHHVYSQLRHMWVLERRNRPYVPVLEGAQPPAATKSAEYNAKYMSVFFRPWTLLSGDFAVPHLRNLGCEGVGGSICAGQGSQNNFTKAWAWYVNGNVVSGAAAQLIRSMLAKALSSRAGEHDEESEADASDVDEDIKPLQLGADDLRSLLRGAAEGDPEVGGEAPNKRKRLRVKSHQESLRTVDTLWKAREGQASIVPAEDVGPLQFDSVREHVAARREKKSRPHRRPPVFGQDHASRTAVRRGESQRSR